MAHVASGNRLGGAQRRLLTLLEPSLLGVPYPLLSALHHFHQHPLPITDYYFSSLIVDSRFLSVRKTSRQTALLLGSLVNVPPALDLCQFLSLVLTRINLHTSRPLLRCPTPDHYILSLIALHTPAPIPSPCPSLLSLPPVPSTAHQHHLRIRFLSGVHSKKRNIIGWVIEVSRPSLQPVV